VCTTNSRENASIDMNAKRVGRHGCGHGRYAGMMTCVHRRVAYLLVWIAATGATMGAAWLGLRSVLDVATPHRAMPLSAADLRRPPTETATPPATGTGRVSTPSAQSVADPPSKPIDAGWVEVSHGRMGPIFERTFHLNGGDLTLESDQWEARVLSEKPKPGFVPFTMRFDIRTILVSFASASPSSRVFVTWRNGPYAEVTEAAG
jgi:hypothetical protein